jgi:uncharacterized protein (DUF2147 family)
MSIIRSIAVFILFTTVAFADITSKTASPVGLWKTVDDVTGQTKSIVAISEDENGMLVGRVVKLFKDPTKRCVACQGNLKNKPILGLEVMKNLKSNKDNQQEWVGGRILDPKNGKTYHCNLKLLEDGQKLRVRGFIGLPLFGRTQTWTKINQSV